MTMDARAANGSFSRLLLAAGVLAILASGCGRPDTPEERAAAVPTEQLRDLSADTRMAAARELGRLRHQPAVPDLIECLSDVRMDVRTAAAEALGEIGDPRAVEPLSGLIQAPNWALRKAVVESLGKLRVPETARVLGQALADENTAVGMAAAHALANGGPAGAALLLAAATNSVPAVRRAAAYGLEKAAMPEAAPALQRLLRDPVAGVRLEAMESLNRRKGAEAASLFVDLVADGDREVRARAAELAAQSPAAVPALGNLSRDADREVRWIAVRALSRIGTTNAIPRLLAAKRDRDERVAGEAGGALERWRRRPEYRPALLGALRGADPAARLSALLLLQDDGGRDLVEPCVGMLGDPDPETRLNAARVVSRSGDAASMDRLAALLEDPSLSVRQVAAAGLIERGDSRAVATLIEGLKRSAAEGGKAMADEELVATLRLLGRGGDARVLDPAVALLSHRGVQVGVAAAQALGQLGDKRATPALSATVAQGDLDRAVAAGFALVRIEGKQATGTIVKRYEADYVAAGGTNGNWKTLGPVGHWLPVFTNLCDPATLDTLIPKLALHGGPFSQDPGRNNNHAARAGTVAAVMSALGAIGDPRAFDPIFRRMRRSQEVDNRYEPRVRLRGAKVLVKLDPVRAVSALAELLDAEGGHREDCLLEYIRLLSELNDARAVPALAGPLGSDIQAVKDNARKAILKIGEPAIPEMVKALETVGVGKRSNLAAILAEFGPSAVAPLVVAAGSGSEKARQGAVWALGQIADPRATGQLLKSLKDSSPRVQAAAAWGLAESRAEAGVEPLVAVLKQDPNATAREAAARALGLLGDARAVAALTATLGETNVMLRGVAVVSLGQIGGDAVADALRDLLKRETNDDVRSAATGALHAVEKGKPAAKEKTGADR